MTRQIFRTLINLHVPGRYCYFYCGVLPHDGGAILADCRVLAAGQCGVGARFAAYSAPRSLHGRGGAPIEEVRAMMEVDHTNSAYVAL